jgi:hypothetical protein
VVQGVPPPLPAVSPGYVKPTPKRVEGLPRGVQGSAGRHVCRHRGRRSLSGCRTFFLPLLERNDYSMVSVHVIVFEWEHRILIYCRRSPMLDQRPGVMRMAEMEMMPAERSLEEGWGARCGLSAQGAALRGSPRE